MFGLQLSTQVTAGDVLTLVGLLGGSIGLVLVLLQIRANNSQARGRFLLDVINRYFDDPEMLRLYHLLDDGHFRFDRNTYKGSLDAKAVSRTLYYFDTVQFLVDKKIISLKDVVILRYRIMKFFRDPEIQKALESYYMLSTSKVCRTREISLLCGM